VSDVPAWALLGDKDSPRSIDIKDRRLPDHTDSRSCACPQAPIVTTRDTPPAQAPVV
jgi:hypothetical protein